MAKGSFAEHAGRFSSRRLFRSQLVVERRYVSATIGTTEIDENE